jgi:hypothetical protein
MAVEVLMLFSQNHTKPNLQFQVTRILFNLSTLQPINFHRFSIRCTLFDFL